MRFIYVFEEAMREQLLALGYALLHSDDSTWVFDNPSGSEPPIDRFSYALSDTMNF